MNGNVVLSPLHAILCTALARPGKEGHCTFSIESVVAKR